MESNCFYTELGANIRRFRKMCNMTQKQLAFSIHKSLACISKYEQGSIAIDIYTLQQIASQLGIQVNQLVPHISTPEVSDADSSHANRLSPVFKVSPLYLYWYRGGKQSLVLHVIEIDHNTSRITCYMEVDDVTNYKNCHYMMLGTMSTRGPNTYLYATNIILPEDFIFACFSNMDLLDSYMVGFLACLNRSYHITSSKCFISNTPTHSSEEILHVIQVSKKELSEFRKSNFFTFGVHQQQY